MAESENIVVGSVVYGESEIATLKAGKYIDLHTADKRFESDLKVSITAKDYDGSVVVEGDPSTGGGECSGTHVIEVAELPTENIDESVVYKCGDSFHKWGKTIEDIILRYADDDIVSLKEAVGTEGGADVTFTFNYAETKPTENIRISEENNLNLYYIEDENSVFVYAEFDGVLGWQEISYEGGFPPIIGTITDASQATEEGTYVILYLGWLNYPLTRGELEITENGTHDVTKYASVNVNVPITADSPLPIQIATEAEMTALLETAEVGSVYKYTGESGTYENGALYVVEESE